MQEDIRHIPKRILLKALESDELRAIVQEEIRKMSKEEIRKMSKEEMSRLVVSKNLKALRKKHDLTQLELAKLTGLQQSSIARYETGRVSITVYNLLIIAKALDESPNALIEGWEKLF